MSFLRPTRRLGPICLARFCLFVGLWALIFEFVWIQNWSPGSPLLLLCPSDGSKDASVSTSDDDSDDASSEEHKVVKRGSRGELQVITHCHLNCFAYSKPPRTPKVGRCNQRNSGLRSKDQNHLLGEFPWLTLQLKTYICKLYVNGHTYMRTRNVMITGKKNPK